jgi:hypothetical protein
MHSERHAWWWAFGLFFALGVLWALSTPVYAVADEPAHVLRAASVARREIVGDKPAGLDDFARIVKVPRHLVANADEPNYRGRVLEAPCFAFLPETTASCFGNLPSESGLIRARTDVGVDPPAYYAVVGLPSLVKSTAGGIYLMRFVSALICAALLASALLTLRRIVPGWIAASGLAFALTPTTAFFSGTVNPNGVEVCAAIGAWASGAVLAHDAATRVDGRLVRRAGIAMVVLVLARGLSLLWLGIIGLTCLALATRAGLRALLASSGVRRWGVAVIAASLFAAAWLLLAGPLDHLARHGPDPGDASAWTLWRDSFGATYDHYRMMIGAVGWIDTYGPNLTMILWTIGLGVLVVLGLALAARRVAALIGALVVVTVVVPVAIDVSHARELGLGWQGRWTLPLAVGVPIVAALGVAWSDRRPLLDRSRLPVVLAVCFVVAHFFMYAQALRRYTVGASGALDFWLHPEWDPPLPGWILLGGTLAVLVMLAVRIWRPDAPAIAGSDLPTEDRTDRPVSSLGSGA